MNRTLRMIATGILLLVAGPGLAGEPTIRTLAAMVEPSQAARESVERLIDDLVNLDAALSDGSFILGLPEPLVALARRGWEAIPALIEHLGDRRLTRSTSRLVADGPRRLVTVGEVLGILLRQLAGDSGISWKTDPDTRAPRVEQVKAWWAEARKSNEADYLARAAVPRLRQETRTYRAIVERLAHKYPQRLSDAYQRLLADRPDVSSRDLVQAITAADLRHSDKVDLLLKGAESSRLIRQAEALGCLARLDGRVFERFLIRSLNALPTATPGRYADCEQVELAQLCWESQSLNVWHALRDAIQKTDVGVRMEVIDWVSRPAGLPALRQRRVVEFLLAFLDDEAVRDVKADPEKFALCAADSWPQIEVRNWAAYQLAKQFRLGVSSVSPFKPVAADAWQRLRNEVARVCEERGIRPDDPSSDEQSRGREALGKLGVLDLPDSFSERISTRVSLAGTEVKDADLRHLRYFPLISMVDLTGTAITDEGLRALGDCRGLRVLILADTKITDAGLAHLARLKWLQQLDLSGTAITDRSVEVLRSLPKLERVTLTQTRISKQARQDLRQARPRLEVVD